MYPDFSSQKHQDLKLEEVLEKNVKVSQCQINYCAGP